MVGRYSRFLPWCCVFLLTLAPLAGCGWAEWPSRGSQAPRTGAPASAPTTVTGQARPLPRGTVETAPTPAPVPSPRHMPSAQDVRGMPAAVIARSGDTVYALSRRHQVPTRAIIDANRLQPPYRLLVGQRIILPRQREHVVLSGETLQSVARGYHVDVYLLASANGLIAPYRIREGQRLTVPLPGGPDQTTAPVTIRSARLHDPESDSESAPGETQETSLTPLSASPSDALESAPSLTAAPIKKPPPRLGKGFIWPVKGKVISGFGPKKKGRHNDGINIAVRRGTPVRAAESGVVAYVGNELRGFGNLILVQHADGWVSAYAHNEELLVRRGDTVHKGQVIAEAGSTGSVDSPQLHFQLRKGKQAVDPRKYLVAGNT